jgi:hypothetical protein
MQQILLRQDASIPGVTNNDHHDLARKAEVSASSEAALKFPEGQTFYAAKFPLAQLFPVSTNRVERVELLVHSTANRPLTLSLRLRRARHVADLASSDDLATASTTLPANYRGYAGFDLNATTQPGSLYVVQLDAPSEVGWGLFVEKPGEPSAIPVGATSADLPDELISELYAMGGPWAGPNGGQIFGRALWRTFTNGQCFTLRVLPEQHPYGPANVVRGTNRPDRWPNIYISDHEIPAWVELRWPESVSFNQVQITFDTNCNRRVSLPLFRYPECVKKYELAVGTPAGWKTIADIDENYSRRRVHEFETVKSDRLRLQVHGTNGSPAARIYEVRVYNKA